MSGTKSPRRTVLIIELDQVELACRMLEASLKLRRPAGATANQALSSVHPEERAQLMVAAMAAMRYFEEQSNAGQVPS